MKTATRAASGANTADAPPVGPENRTAGKNEYSRIMHVTDEFRGRRALPPRPCNFRKAALESALEKLGRQLRPQPHRKSHHVRDASFQPLYQSGSKGLDRVTA